MKLKVVYTKHIPLKGFVALTLWPFIFGVPVCGVPHHILSGVGGQAAVL